MCHIHAKRLSIITQSCFSATAGVDAMTSIGVIKEIDLFAEKKKHEKHQNK